MSLEKERGLKMLNTLAMLGKVKKLPEIVSLGDGFGEAYMELEVDEPFRCEDGSLGSCVFEVKLWRGIAQDCIHICRLGDLISLKGRLHTRKIEVNGKEVDHTYVIAEQVSFVTKRVEALQNMKKE